MPYHIKFSKFLYLFFVKLFYHESLVWDNGKPDQFTVLVCTLVDNRLLLNVHLLCGWTKLLLSGFHKKCLESLKIEGNSELQNGINSKHIFSQLVLTAHLWTGQHITF